MIPDNIKEKIKALMIERQNTLAFMTAAINDFKLTLESMKKKKLEREMKLKQEARENSASFKQNSNCQDPDDSDR